MPCRRGLLWHCHSCSYCTAAYELLSLQRLLQLEAADLYQLVDTKLDADLLLDAISDLKTGDQVSSPLKNEIPACQEELCTKVSEQTIWYTAQGNCC